MVMLRPPGKPQEIATKVLKNKGVKVPKNKELQKPKIKPEFVKH
jgi:hypothetical protein